MSFSGLEMALGLGAGLLLFVAGFFCGRWRRPGRAIPHSLTEREGGDGTFAVPAAPVTSDELQEGAPPTPPVTSPDLPSQIAAGEAQRLRETVDEMSQTIAARDAQIAALEADLNAAQAEVLVAPVTRVSAFSAQGTGAMGRNEHLHATQPLTLAVARGNAPDDLKQIHGVGETLEALLHRMGYFHFDQIAAWSAQEVAWVDENLPGFRGRVSRDSWVEQAQQFVRHAAKRDGSPSDQPGDEERPH
ncbi:MAG: hypothetical protein AAFR93_16140 [Pseudomonadota bacterium]